MPNRNGAALLLRSDWFYLAKHPDGLQVNSIWHMPIKMYEGDQDLDSPGHKKNPTITDRVINLISVMSNRAYPNKLRIVLNHPLRYPIHYNLIRLHHIRLETKNKIHLSTHQRFLSYRV